MEHLLEWNIFKKYKKPVGIKQLGDIKVGDYVVAEEDDYDIEQVMDFIKNNIGKVVDIWEENPNPYIVEYENVPEEDKADFSWLRNKQSKFRENVWGFTREEIKYFGTKEEMEKQLELLQQTRKFNL